jgi:hypothetical protein
VSEFLTHWPQYEATVPGATGAPSPKP